MAAIVAAAAGACAPGCAGLLAAGGSLFSFPVISALSVVSVIGAALLSKGKEEDDDTDLSGSTMNIQQQDAPKGTGDFL